MSNSLSLDQQSRALQMAQGQSSIFHVGWVMAILKAEGLNSQDQVLDFGAGQGAILQALQDHGNKNLVGADLLECPTGLNARWKKADLNQFPCEEYEKKFDWVLGVEVIEHLENPRNVIRQMQKMTKLGGKILITTPHVESFRSLISYIFRGHFVDFLDSSYPAHITPLIPMDLTRILKECDLEICRIEFSHRGVLPFFTKVSWQAISLGLLKGRRFSDHILVVARQAK